MTRRSFKLYLNLLLCLKLFTLQFDLNITLFHRNMIGCAFSALWLRGGFTWALSMSLSFIRSLSRVQKTHISSRLTINHIPSYENLRNIFLCWRRIYSKGGVFPLSDLWTRFLNCSEVNMKHFRLKRFRSIFLSRLRVYYFLGFINCNGSLWNN